MLHRILGLTLMIALFGVVFASVQASGTPKIVQRISERNSIGGSQIFAPLVSKMIVVDPPTGRWESPFLQGSGEVYPAGDTLLFQNNGQVLSENNGRTWTFPEIPTNLSTIVTAFEIAPGYPTDPYLFRGLENATSAFQYSTDNGATWQSSIDSFPGRVASLAVSPTFATDRTVYATVRNVTQIYISTDAGLHWTSRPLPTRAWGQVEAANGVLFVRDVDLLHLYRSTDNGITWTPADNGLFASTDNRLYDFAISPQFATDQTLFAATRFGLYRSTSGGTEWQQVNATPVKNVVIPSTYNSVTNPAFFTLGAVPDYPDVPYPNDIYWVTENGSTIIARPLPENLNANSLSIRTRSDNTLQLYTSSNTNLVWTSNDLGATWEIVSEAGYPNMELGWVEVSPNFENDGTAIANYARIIYDDNETYFLRTLDAGLSWESVALPEIGKPLGVFSPDYATDNTMYLAVGTSFYRSTNLGDSWTRIGSLPAHRDGFSNPELRISPDFAKDQTLFFIGSDGLYRTTNGGDEWVRVVTTTHLQDVEISGTYGEDQTLYYAGGTSLLTRSMDGGTTWDPVTTPNGFSQIDVVLSPNYASDQTLFVREMGSQDGGGLRSEDGGATWRILTGESQEYWGTTLAISPNYANDISVVVGREFRGIYLSQNKGMTWYLLHGANENSWGQVAITRFNGELFILYINPNGIYRYTP